MTGEPGDECPECRRRLIDGLCTCGWRPSSASTAPRCVDCGEATRLELDEDRALRCAACHVVYLRARAARDPISVGALEQCRVQIAAALTRVVARTARRPTSIAVFEAPGVDPGGSHPEDFSS